MSEDLLLDVALAVVDVLERRREARLEAKREEQEREKTCACGEFTEEMQNATELTEEEFKYRRQFAVGCSRNHLPNVRFKVIWSNPKRKPTFLNGAA